MKNPPKHIILDYTNDPSEFVCVNCGAKRQLHLPAAINDVVRQAEAFVETHKHCKVQRENEQKT